VFSTSLHPAHNLRREIGLVKTSGEALHHPSKPQTTQPVDSTTAPDYPHSIAVIEDMRVDLGGSPCGQISEIVTDPRARRVTQVVVQPHRAVRGARLVDVHRFRFHDTHAELMLSGREFADATVAAQTHPHEPTHWPHLDAQWDVGIVRVLRRPYLMSVPADPESDGWSNKHGPCVDDTGSTVTYNRIPRGTVALRGASTVISSDGHQVAHVRGLLVDEEFTVTDLLLEPRHPWNRQLVPLPVDDVAALRTDEVRLRISADELNRRRARHHALLRHSGGERCDVSRAGTADLAEPPQ